MFKHLKKVFLISTFCFLTGSVLYANNWSWANTAGGQSWDDAMCTVFDSDGGVCVTGNFGSDTISFGKFVLKNSTNHGTSDIFVVKYDASGNVLWAHSAGGNFDEKSNSVATDRQNNIYITGSFSSTTISFDKIMLTNSGPFGSEDIFLVKYSPAGVVLWAKNVQGDGDDSGKGVKTDALGNVYLSGSFNDNIYFGKDSSVISKNKNICLLKFDTSGKPLWAKFASGNGDACGTSLAIDAADNIYHCGFFDGRIIVFGKDTLINFAPGRSDIFITKSNSAGEILWAKSFRGNGNDIASSVTVDAMGHIFMTGYFNSSSIFLGKEKFTNTLSSQGLVFIAQFDSSGQVIWAKSAGAEGFQSGNSISADSKGNVFITGNFESEELLFGTIKLKNSGKTGSKDIFITEYDMNGKLISAQSIGGNDDDLVRSIAVDKNSKVSLSGYFKSNKVNFSGLLLKNENLGSADVFVVQ